MDDVKRIKNIWKKQLDYVLAIAEDIIRNNGSKEVLEHAAGYAHIEGPINFKGKADDNDSIRISWGEAYAYIDYEDEDYTKLIKEISWNNDEMGISRPECNTYAGSVSALEQMTSLPALNYDYGEISDIEYKLIYNKLAG